MYANLVPGELDTGLKELVALWGLMERGEKWAESSPAYRLGHCCGQVCWKLDVIVARRELL